ncbi:FG-GAP repeat domain-containing protein [Planctomycetota bacterium]
MEAPLGFHNGEVQAFVGRLTPHTIPRTGYNAHEGTAVIKHNSFLFERVLTMFFVRSFCRVEAISFCILFFACFAANAIANETDPKFTLEVIDDDISIGYGLAIGEVNGDSKIDILLADKSEIVWYQNPGRRGETWVRHVMARNLTERDNVCIAARDLNGDGKVEVAVGANWNPGNTSDTAVSGALFYLERPADPTKQWRSSVISDHDPTTHRMHWIRDGGRFSLAVLPLHGRDNKNGEGSPVRVTSYTPSEDYSQWSAKVLDASMHMTHNFELVSGDDKSESLLVAGREGLKRVTTDNAIMLVPNPPSRGAGEVRAIDLSEGDELIAIEPMHGTDVVYYRNSGGSWKRKLLDGSLAAGHAIATGDLLHTGKAQVVAGWRNRNSDGKVGIRLYSPSADGNWTTHTIDDNVTATEDLKLADLDGDGKSEIIAAGRATKNVVVYWNEN